MCESQIGEEKPLEGGGVFYGIVSITKNKPNNFSMEGSDLKSSVDVLIFLLYKKEFRTKNTISSLRQ